MLRPPSHTNPVTAHDPPIERAPQPKPTAIHQAEIERHKLAQVHDLLDLRVKSLGVKGLAPI